MTMRVFLMLLIFAIGFSGYSVAAHAFGPDSCNTTTMSQMVDDGMDASDCSGHQADQDTQTDTDQGKSSKAKCMDCTHCCSSHALNLAEYSVGLPPLSAVLNAPPIHGYEGEYFLSLLRPPKSLV